jgi:hypothetical protein
MSLYLYVVSYGCKIYFLIPKKQHILRVSEKGVSRRAFVSKRNEVTGKVRKIA